MTESRTESRTGNGAMLLVVFTAALTMRAPMGCVGPMVGQIQSDLGISAFSAGFLTTIPLIAFALTAPPAGRVAAAVKSGGLLLGMGTCLCQRSSTSGSPAKSAWSWASPPGPP